VKKTLTSGKARTIGKGRTRLDAAEKRRANRGTRQVLKRETEVLGWLGQRIP
jgi:hypothetical protein